MNIKSLVIFLILFLSAKSNPFRLEQNISMVAPPYFQKRDIHFDSSARILKSISFHYINLDGSEDSLEIDINESIDWHHTYTIIRKELDSSKNFNTLADEMPLRVDQIYDFLPYAIYKNKIKFDTSHRLISDFSIGNPSKIILDFQSDQSIYPSKSISTHSSIFERIDFDSHAGYYRLVIQLDGLYNYSIVKDATGYMLIII